MRRIILACFVIFVSVNLAFVDVLADKLETGRSDKMIHWQDNHKLSWSDFKGSPRNYGNISALTASAIEYSYACDRGVLSVNINAYFFPEDSWVRPDAMNKYILSHEQLHFDITELYARKLRKALTENIRGCQDTRKIDALAKKVLEEWKKDQSAYDAQTHHSIRKEDQSRWNREIDRALTQYSAYTVDRWNGTFAP